MIPWRKFLSRSQSPSIPAEYGDLWRKLAAFPIDDPAAEHPLSKRLASEQDWTHEYAVRVVEEYRKFIFLCMISKKMCTPSLSVDEAWHLHLIYTRAYWEQLCVRTLGRLIHHEPAQGGGEDEAKFQELYVTTLELYARVFGEPPEDIWGYGGIARRKPAACAAVRGAVPQEKLSADDQEFLTQIQKAAERLKQAGS